MPSVGKPVTKIIYLSPLRYPSQKAGSLFSMKSAEAFAYEGINTELWAPRRRNTLSNHDPFEFSGVQSNFSIKYFPTIDMIGILPGGYQIMSCIFALSVFLYVLKIKISGKIDQYAFYSHEQYALFLLTFVSNRTYYEIHDFPKNNGLYRLLFKRIKGIISTNNWKSLELENSFKLKKDFVHTVKNAVDLSDFMSTASIEDAKKALRINPNDYLVGYVGALKTMGMEKGIGILIDALRLLDPSYKLYIVGGNPEDIRHYSDYATNVGVGERVIFAGNIPHKEIELHTSACDVLVAPYSDTEHYRHYMSPMKVFEYMASRRPMIVTDLPSISEIVDERMAIFVPPDNPQAIAEAISRIEKDPELGVRLASEARKKVEGDFTWKKRAKDILNIFRVSLPNI